MSRHTEPFTVPDVSTGGITVEITHDLVPMIRKLQVAVDEIRAQLGGMRKDYYTVEEVARATGRSSYTIRSWVRAGRIRAIRVEGTGPRGRLLIAREEMERLVYSGLAGQVSAAVVK
ncbi:helix-turn-helix domain-containing protein [Singulisphaera sp. Ch08]|uniref:Helix-turn-helix domain-containing protein n=1 Tax=Singulisphaera sp. Ch08 TaxID=3120278 RepID=A0AAU7CND5_9BACT